MCAIVGSFDIDEFYDLVKRNSYRGSHSYSIAAFDIYTEQVEIIDKGFGEMPVKDIHNTNKYLIGHVQAPTTDSKNESSIHPAVDRGDLLWHNGIIKAHQVKEWQTVWKKQWEWDTKWLLHNLNTGDIQKTLSEADGSFACLWYHQYSGLSLFRNENSPMFVKGHTISSTRFAGSESLESGVVFDFKLGGWIKSDKKFKTAEEFFWSPE